MGLRFRIFIGMLAVVLVALVATAVVAFDFSQKQELAYNSQRLLRKEAALSRSSRLCSHKERGKPSGG